MNVIRLGSANIELCRQAAQLHISSIHHGLLPMLGEQFMTKMYLGIALAPESGVWAIVDGDKFLGFVAGCASIQRTYRWIMVNYGFRLAIAAGLALFRLAVLRKLHSILLYPFRQHNVSTETSTLDAELLAIAIHASEHGKGYGKKLVYALESSLRQWGVREYRVLTNIAETKSNVFYRATGFALAGTIKHHALTLQVYRKMLLRQEVSAIEKDR